MKVHVVQLLHHHEAAMACAFTTLPSLYVQMLTSVQLG
jgi:hypothetical protein